MHEELYVLITYGVGCTSDVVIFVVTQLMIKMDSPSYQIYVVGLANKEH